MEVKRNWYYLIISFCATMLFLLGGWWLYLVFKLANKLSHLNHPALEGNLISMIKWEGFTFIFLLLILTVTFLYIYILDHRKTKSLQAFFSSLTHELKTPLASMKLQAQVLNDALDNPDVNPELKSKLSVYTDRLIHDSVKLEDQLDNHLQLSRVERHSPINMRSIDLKEFLQKEISRFKNIPPINIQTQEEDYFILADDYALQTIIRNLVENTLSHNKSADKINIEIIRNQGVSLAYTDYNSQFSGDINKLGELFYKFNSPQGSGIGLYLINRLMDKMHGSFKITNDQCLVFHLDFKKGKPS